jgi:flagellar P-ring protein precursor FlgI
MTPLNAADGAVYAVAQGPVLASGVDAEGEAAEASIGVPTVATIPGGARVEREIGFRFDTMPVIRLSLRKPDFTTAGRIEDAINRALGAPVARMNDAGTVTLDVERSGLSPPRLLGRIENLPIAPAQVARVVVDQRSGTIVLGSDVRISEVAVAQGNLAIRVTERPVVAQPNPFAEGETVAVPRTDIEIDEDADRRLALIEENVTLADLVEGLNALGVGPREMIDILKTIDAAGALHAELVVN